MMMHGFIVYRREPATLDSSMFRSLNLLSCSAKAYKIIGYNFQENTRKEDQKLKLKPEACHHSPGRLKIYLNIRDTV